MNNLSRLKKEIKEIIANSKVPEDLDHAQNTVDWLLRLKPDADEALQLAALGHDIERAVRDETFKRASYPSYDAFKRAHAEKSALIIRDVILRHGLSDDFAEQVSRLVAEHERGGSPRSDLLKDADSLSFFDVNLPWYFEREGRERAAERCRWGYERLSVPNRRLLETFVYENPEIADLLGSVLREKGLSL